MTLVEATFSLIPATLLHFPSHENSKLKVGGLYHFREAAKFLFPLTLNVCCDTQKIASYLTLKSIYLSDVPIHWTPLSAVAGVSFQMPT